MAARCLRPRRGGVVLALAAALVGLLAAPGARAAVPTFTGAVVSADPGPIVEGSVYFATTDILLGFTGFGPGGSFSFPVPADRRLEGGVTVRVSASSVAFHYGKEERITITCRFVAAVFTCDPIPPVILTVASMFGNIQGTVQDNTGRPVEGAVVSAVPTDGGYVPVARTDAAGAYLFPPYDPHYPMFGRGISVPEGGSHTYVVSVSLPTGGPPPNPQQVMVTGGVIVGASFGGRPPAPPENRPQDTAQGPGDPCGKVGKPISVTTGNMYTQQQDLAYPSAFGRFAFTRTYNSQSSYQGPLGLGWTHPFDFELKELRPGVIRVRNGAGKVRFYELVTGSSDTYRVAAPARETSTLVKSTSGFTETERDGLRWEFDPNGRLQAIVTRAGWRTALTYSNGRLATVTDPGGRTLTFIYTDTKLTRVEGPGGLFAQYTYDPQGRLLVAADALGARWSYTYSDTTPSHLTSVRDANGHLVEQHTYDTAGRVIATTEAEGVKALTLEYLDTSHTRVTDSLNRGTTYTFGNFGDLLLVTQIQGPCACGSPDSTFEYDAQGRRTRQTDGRGNSTAFEYDAEGNLIKVIDALGHVTTSTYNSFGQVLSTTDPTGAVTTFEYHHQLQLRRFRPSIGYHRSDGGPDYPCL
ncbi:MAG: carboxypeptidase regulatory-like domain-containing protein [candidate division NC10 bacterium]|nr:carboxypeptidase regulatory-like domain-containing protein [candidate division NC10 bacterium]